MLHNMNIILIIEIQTFAQTKFKNADYKILNYN